MKRIKNITLILFFIMLFMPLTKVSAASCADVKSAVNEIDSLEAQYTSLGCENADNRQTLSKCNTITSKKMKLMEDIFYFHTEQTCSSIDLSTLVNKYKDNCSNEFSSELKTMTKTVMNLFYITAPFLMIIFGSLDFFKIVAGNNPDEIKKHRSNFFKRLVAFVLLYLTPFITNIIFSMMPYNIQADTYICSQTISLKPKTTSPTVTGQYNVDNYSGDAGKRIAEAAKEIKQNAINNHYTYGCNSSAPSVQGTSKIKQMCCANLIGAAIYKAKVYTEKEATFKDAYAATVVQALIDKKWKVIKNEKDLKPGDVLAWECEWSGCNKISLEGKSYRVGHVDIYYGDKKKVSTGGSFARAVDNYQTRFCHEGHCKHFLIGLRYAGK